MIIQFILSDKHLYKVKLWHFYITSNEVMWPNFFFKLHVGVKKCHFGNFSERAGMAMPGYCGPQKCIIAFSFMLKYSKITVWCTRYLRKISVEMLGVRLMKILLFCHHYVLVLTINKTMFARGVKNCRFFILGIKKI